MTFHIPEPTLCVVMLTTTPEAGLPVSWGLCCPSIHLMDWLNRVSLHLQQLLGIALSHFHGLCYFHSLVQGQVHLSQETLLDSRLGQPTN
ncbi:MAG: hypothetical protein MPL62_12655 [Alphaproteobacteria bacterium]|nr:hypothetical protein [Alphaproteobacteria bacterium]